jgi:hypothetical protein
LPPLYFQMGTSPNVLQVQSNKVFYLNVDAPQYIVTLLVKDGPPVATQKTATAACIVNIVEKNNNAPVFTSAAGSTIPENTAIGSVIYNAATTDADWTAGLSSHVTYNITTGDTTLFGINSVTGEVILLGPLNYEINPGPYTITIMVNFC